MTTVASTLIAAVDVVVVIIIIGVCVLLFNYIVLFAAFVSLQTRECNQLAISLHLILHTS